MFVNNYERGWTKRERTVLNTGSRQIARNLALAVLEQWKLDGRPLHDKRGIEPWLAVASMCADDNLYMSHAQVTLR